MKPETRRIKVSAFAHFYALSFAVAVIGWPLLWTALYWRHVVAPVSAWRLAALGVTAMLLLSAYAWWRCSSDALGYWDGLLVVAASMRTGWTYNSLVVVLPSLLFTFCSSLVFAVQAEVRQTPGDASMRFRALIGGFYQKRLLR